MSIPTQPTEMSIATKAYTLYGKTPNTAGLNTLVSDGLAMVKSDLMDEGKEWDFLRRKVALPCTIAQSHVEAPSDFSKVISAVMCDGARSGTAQAGSSTTITLAASETAVEKDTIGKEIAIKSGTGANQLAQITAYNTTTKVATISSLDTWTAPDATSTYLIVDIRRNMILEDIWEYDKRDLPHLPQEPHILYHAADDSEGVFRLDYAPDKEYVIILRYYSDLQKEDTDVSANPRYARILRLLEQVFVQGGFMWLLQDDGRTQMETMKYSVMVQRAASRFLKLATKAGLAEDAY